MATFSKRITFLRWLNFGGDKNVVDLYSDVVIVNQRTSVRLMQIENRHRTTFSKSSLKSNKLYLTLLFICLFFKKNCFRLYSGHYLGFSSRSQSKILNLYILIHLISVFHLSRQRSVHREGAATAVNFLGGHLYQLIFNLFEQ